MLYGGKIKERMPQIYTLLHQRTKQRRPGASHFVLTPSRAHCRTLIRSSTPSYIACGRQIKILGRDHAQMDHCRNGHILLRQQSCFLRTSHHLAETWRSNNYPCSYFFVASRDFVDGACPPCPSRPARQGSRRTGTMPSD